MLRNSSSGSGIPYGCLPLIIFLVIASLPFLLADVVLNALSRLGLSPFSALLVGAGIFLGGVVNIPVKRISRAGSPESGGYAMFGFDRFIPGQSGEKNYTIIAVNVGGCLIPGAIAVYELLRVTTSGGALLVSAGVAIFINIIVCYKIAKPVPHVGIAMPGLVPALVAAICAVMLDPQMAPQIAFMAGVFGPLIGADLLHLKDIKNLNTGMASIGGAGTFDGIVLSGLIATLLV